MWRDTQGEDNHVMTEAEIVRCIYREVKPRISSHPPKSRRGKEGFYAESQKKCGLTDTEFTLLASRSVREQIPFVLSQALCGLLHRKPIQWLITIRITKLPFLSIVIQQAMYRAFQKH